MQLRLSGPQLDEKREAEAALKDIEEALALEEDAGKQAELQAGVAAAQQKLDDLMTAFAVSWPACCCVGGVLVCWVSCDGCLGAAAGGATSRCCWHYWLSPCRAAHSLAHNLPPCLPGPPACPLLPFACRRRLLWRLPCLAARHACRRSGRCRQSRRVWAAATAGGTTTRPSSTAPPPAAAAAALAGGILTREALVVAAVAAVLAAAAAAAALVDTTSSAPAAAAAAASQTATSRVAAAAAAGATTSVEAAGACRSGPRMMLQVRATVTERPACTLACMHEACGAAHVAAHPANAPTVPHVKHMGGSTGSGSGCSSDSRRQQQALVASLSGF